MRSFNLSFISSFLTDIGGKTKEHFNKIYDLEFDLAVTIDEFISLRKTGNVVVKVVGVGVGNLSLSS